jgi:thiol-disulfide isomerase/thioredoxin
VRNETGISRFAGIAANVGVAILCVTLSAAVAKKAFWADQPKAPPGQIKAGDRISLPNVKLGPGDTVLLALREGCHFCEASMPLYKQLVEAAQSAKGKRVVAVLPEAADKGKSYLHSHGVDVSDVYNVPLSQLQVRGTPTLLLLNESGVVKRAWYGQQPTEQNVRIVRDIFGGS